MKKKVEEKERFSFRLLGWWWFCNPMYSTLADSSGFIDFQQGILGAIVISFLQGIFPNPGIDLALSAFKANLYH